MFSQLLYMIACVILFGILSVVGLFFMYGVIIVSAEILDKLNKK